MKSKSGKHDKSCRQWWRTVNSISDRECKDVPLSSLFALLEVNKYFQGIILILTTSMFLKGQGSQLLMSSLLSNFSHDKKGLLLDLMACHTGSGENLQMNLLPQLLLSSTYLLSLKLYLIFGSWLISTRFLRRSPCHLSVTDIIIRLFTRHKLSLRLVLLFN